MNNEIGNIRKFLRRYKPSRRLIRLFHLQEENEAEDTGATLLSYMSDFIGAIFIMVGK